MKHESQNPGIPSSRNPNHVKLNARARLFADPDVWAAMIAAKFARQIGLPVGNYWEPPIARTLAKAVREGRKTRDEIAMLMALQLGLNQGRV